MNSYESQALFAITAVVIMSLIYFIILEILEKRRDTRNNRQKRILFVWRKLSGFLLLAVVPGLTGWLFFRIDPVVSGMVFSGSISLWGWVVLAMIFFTGLNHFNAGKADLQARYPELRLSVWRPSDLVLSASGWLVYLTGYEFLFRGLLLFSCYHYLGLWPAIVINLALYSTLHLPKGLKEAIAAIPFGALLCYLTLESRSILPAIIIHTVQAVSCEIFCMIRNPKMSFSFKTYKS